MNFIFYCIFMSLLSVFLVRKHILIVLISLEFLVISLLMLILFFCLFYDYNFYIYIYFMVFYICEAVLGLSVLVHMIRCCGNDYLNSLFLW
nr:NADH dehydrogenase subunit 4L [Tartessus sp.]